MSAVFAIAKTVIKYSTNNEYEYKKESAACFCEKLNASEFFSALLKNAFELGGYEIAKDWK